MKPGRPERSLERVAGTLSVGAGLLHGGLTADHFALGWGYGAFFAGATLAQAVLGLALLTDAFEPRAGPSARMLRWRAYVAGIAGNLVLLLVYVLSRTKGIAVGPGSGAPEPVAAVDILTKALEMGVVVALLAAIIVSVRASAPPSA